MSKTKVGLLIQHILHAVGSIFKHSIKGAEKDYNNLSDEDKAALQHGAGVLTFISQQIDKTPAEIKESILEEFPDLDVDNLEKGLYTIAHAFNLAPEENNVEDTIAKLKAHFDGLHGTVWNAIVQAAAGIFSFVVAPAGSKLSAGIDLVKYVYLAFFKKKKTVGE